MFIARIIMQIIQVRICIIERLHYEPHFIPKMQRKKISLHFEIIFLIY